MKCYNTSKVILMNTLFKAVNITLPKVILQEKIAGNLDESIRLID